MPVITNYKDDALNSFRSYKRLAERAIEQVSDAEFFHPIDGEANSIAVIVKHISGNLHSRWRLPYNRRRKTRPEPRHRIRDNR